MGRAAADDDEADEVHRLQRNASSGFSAAMQRLERLYEGREAPTDFKERLDFWREGSAMPVGLHRRMQTLRIWRNASEHHDSERWRREGPREPAELTVLLSAIDAALNELERSSDE